MACFQISDVGSRISDLIRDLTGFTAQHIRDDTPERGDLFLGGRALLRASRRTLVVTARFTLERRLPVGAAERAVALEASTDALVIGERRDAVVMRSRFTHEHDVVA